MNSPSSPLQVVCAVILNKAGDFLACQRGSSSDLVGKWEFPGGKVDSGETQRSALIREIREELDVDIEVLEKMNTVRHQYPNLHIHLHPYTCRISSNGLPKALEHAAIRWTTPQKAASLDWADADVAILQQLLYKSETL